MSRFFDCLYAGIDLETLKHIVREQLYPEVRGWIEHEFETETAALNWLAELKSENN